MAEVTMEHGKPMPDDNVVVLDEVMAAAGLGYFHLRLVMACGLGFSAAAVEVVLSGFLLTEIREKWHASEYTLSLLPTIVGIGTTIGELFWGWVADRCGRRIVFLVTVGVVVLFGVLSAFSPGMVMLTATRCLVGTGYGGNIAVDFTLYVEMLPTRNRGEMLIAVAAFWPLGQTVTVLLAWLTIPNYGWRTFLIACAVPSFLTCFLRPFIPESPRWLLLRGYESEAIEVCRQIAELNGLTAEQVGLARGGGTRLVLSNEAEKLYKPEGETPSMMPSLISKTLWKTTLGCLIFSGMLSWGGYASMTFMPSFLQMKGMESMDMYKSMLISSVSQVPGILLAAWCGRRIGRLGPMSVSLLLQAAALSVFAFVRTSALMIFCSCLASCFSEFGWAFSHVYVPEAFPTEVRALALGVVSGMGSVISLFAPLLTATLLDWGSAALAVLVFAAVLVLGSISIFFLLHVETLDRDLVDTAS